MGVLLYPRRSTNFKHLFYKFFLFLEYIITHVIYCYNLQPINICILNLIFVAIVNYYSILILLWLISSVYSKQNLFRTELFYQTSKIMKNYNHTF